MSALPAHSHHAAHMPCTPLPAKHANDIGLQLPTGVLQVQVEEGDFALDALLGFAARANTKRGFLFLSKVLGKHYPSEPMAMLRVQQYLAAQIPPDLPGPVLFIAMAETAIGLGQGVFEAWLASGPQQAALFLHSSRYALKGVADTARFEFAESHSHAPRQFLHIPQEGEKRDTFMQAKSLVIIDDEASTGNTFVNLCAAYRQLNPGLQRLHLGVIANFISATARQQLGFGLPYTFGAALNAQYQFAARPLSDEMLAQIAAHSAQRYDAGQDNGASAAFGRFGCARALATPLAKAQQLQRQIGNQEKVLVLGTGEFMHAPFLLALAMQQLGMQVVLQSTTRSPILQWGDCRHALTFADNYREGIRNYLYNVTPGQYSHVLLCHETAANAELMALARMLSARLLHFQSEHEIEEIPVC